MLSLPSCFALLACFFIPTTAVNFWIVPNGQNTDFTQNFPANVDLVQQWNGQPAADALGFNTSVTVKTLFDLFAMTYTDSQANGYNQLVASNVNLTVAGSVRWNVSVPATVLAKQQNYILRFLTAPGDHSGFSSPGFLIQGSGTSSTTTSTSQSASATTTPTASVTPTPTPSSSELSTGAKAAISVVIPITMLSIVGGLVYLFLRRKKRTVRGAEEMSGEMHKDKPLPVGGAPPPGYTIEMAGVVPRELGGEARHEL